MEPIRFLDRREVLAAALGAAVAGSAHAGLRFHGQATSAPPLPVTQTVNFYTKQRTGYGASLLSYTGGGTLSIVSQKDASNASVTIFQIGQNALSWKGASATYGTAPPASLNGPYTVVVTDGTYTSTVTIPIVAGACLREMTSVADGGRWATDSMYTVDDHASGSINWQLSGYFDAAGKIAEGDTIYCRDGAFNPKNWLYYFQPHASYSGVHVTITSETWDTTLDANGNPRLQNGFKSGCIYLYTGGNFPVTFDHLWFYTNAVTPSAAGFLLTANGSGTTGVTATFCRAECGSSVSPASANGVIAFKLDSGVCSDNHVIACGQGMVLSACTSQRNVVEQQQVDAFFIGVGPHTLTDNLVFDVRGVVPDHPDAIQFTGIQNTLTSGGTGYVPGTYTNVPLTGGTVAGVLATIVVNGGGAVASVTITNNGTIFPTGTALSASNLSLGGSGSGFVWTTNSDKQMGSILRNTFAIDTGTQPTQGIFLSDVNAPAKLTGVIMKNNIDLLNGANGLTLLSDTSPVDECNTSLADIVKDPSAINHLIQNATPPWPGSDGTFSYNLGNAFGLTGQTGSPTFTPATQVTIAANQSAYEAAFPNLYSSMLAGTLKSRAAILRAATPYDKLVASGGVMNPDGTANGALFPAPSGTGETGPWNDKSVYDPTNPTWVAAHPPAT